MTDYERLTARLADGGRNYSVEIHNEGLLVFDFGKLNQPLGRVVYWRFDIDGKLMAVSSRFRAWWRLLGTNASDPNT